MREQRQQNTQAPPECWCCGSVFPNNELLHLGQHPEVGVCAGCARWLHRRAARHRDERHPTAAAYLRRAVDGGRSWVIGRGWHRSPVVGGLLRRLDRYLP